MSPIGDLAIDRGCITSYSVLMIFIFCISMWFSVLFCSMPYLRLMCEVIIYWGCGCDCILCVCQLVETMDFGYSA